MLKMKTTKRYDKYKDSGIEWIGEIPDSWCVRKLNSLLNAIGSGTTPKGNDNYYDGDIYWLNTGDLNDSYISTINKTVTEIALQECSTLKIFPKDSVVIAMYGATIGKLGILMFPATTNQACCVMSCSEQLNNKYLFYLLFAAREFIINLSYGAGQPNISQETIKSFRLSFPSIKEQEAIVGYLDRKCGAIDETIEKQKSVIEKLKEYKQSIITQAVTKGLDKSAPMKDSGIEWIGQIPQHWDTCKIKHKFYLSSEINYDPTATLLSLFTHIGVRPRTEMEDKGNKAQTVIGYSLVKNGDIIVNKLLAWMGAIGLSDYNGATSPDYDIYRLRNVTDNNAKYYHYLFRSNNFKDECYKYGRGIMLMRLRTYPEEFLNIFIPNITKAQQNDIVEFLDKKCSEIDKTIEDKEKLIEKLVEYKKSLIYECVTGKRKVVA